MGCVVASIPNRTADAIHHDIGHAHGLQVAKKPKYTLFSKDPAKYLDLQEYLPHRESLTEDFNWVKPCSMSPEQLFAWACHLFDRQQRKKNGEKIEVLAFYPVQQGKGKARIPATSSVEEYIQNLPHVLARHSEQSGSSGSGTSKRPFVPGAEANASGGKGLELNTNILFEAESPGSVLSLWKDCLGFLRKLCKDAGYGKLLAWLEKVQVC